MSSSCGIVGLKQWTNARNANFVEAAAALCKLVAMDQ